jgi:hypothetical protein
MKEKRESLTYIGVQCIHSAAEFWCVSGSVDGYFDAELSL